MSTPIEKINTGIFSGERMSFGSKVLNTPVTFCKLRTSDKQPSETVYFFHGGAGDDKMFVDIGLLNLIQGDLADLIKKRNIQIVLPFIGRSFLHEHPTQPERSYSRFFFEELVPLVETDTQTSSNTRWIGGLSMGGQAALNTFLRRPEMFKGVGAHFPTLIDFDYTDSAAVESFVQRTSITPPMLKVLLEEFQNEFISKEDYASHAPVDLLRKYTSQQLSALNGKRIYLDVGSKDDFGLAEGCLVFHDILKKMEIQHSFECMPDGRHDGLFVTAQFPKLVRYLFS